MTPAESQSKLRAAIRLRHLSLSTEQSYCSWLVRYMKWLSVCAHTCASSEERLEGFLSQLARDGVSASTQNQAFNALLLFYREVLQQPSAMGHNSLETTMGYLHADALSVRSPLEYATPITGPIS